MANKRLAALILGIIFIAIAEITMQSKNLFLLIGFSDEVAEIASFVFLVSAIIYLFFNIRIVWAIARFIYNKFDKQ